MGKVVVTPVILLPLRQTVLVAKQAAEVDALSGMGQVAEHDLARRAVAVLGESVMFGEPGVFPTGAVGQLHQLDLALEHLVLGGGVVRRRPRQVALKKEPELHYASQK